MKTENLSKKTVLLLVSFSLILCVSIAGATAFLVDETEDVVNTAIPGSVPNEIIEEFENNVKNNVAVENKGNVDAYIRVAVAVNWVDENGNIHPKAPVENVDYVVTWLINDGWAKGSDDFYYYSRPVPPDDDASTTDIIEDRTTVLFTDCKVKEGVTPPKGYSLSVEIMSQSVQALGVITEGDNKGTPAVTDAWGVVVNADGSISAPTSSAPATPVP